MTPGHASRDVRSLFPYPPPASCLLRIVYVFVCGTLSPFWARLGRFCRSLFPSWRGGWLAMTGSPSRLTMRWSVGRSCLARPLLVFPASGHPLLGPAHVCLLARACLPFRASCDICGRRTWPPRPLTPHLIWTVLSGRLFLLFSPLLIHIAS